jgi:hypothetical protein
MILYLIFLSMAFLYSLLLLRWNSDGHVVMTREALKTALDNLNEQQFAGMGVSQKTLLRMMTWLGLYNTSEDVEWCNIEDLEIFMNQPEHLADIIHRHAKDNPFLEGCAVSLGGDQVTHYMQSFDIPAQPSYLRSNQQIREYSWSAWELLNESFHHMRGFLGRLQGMVLEAQNTSAFDLLFGQAMQDIISRDEDGTWVSKLGVPYAWIERHGMDYLNPFNVLGNTFRDGQHYLGRALHTLQDSFSPAHTRREPRSNFKTLVTLYAYDQHNKLEPMMCPVCKSDGSVPGDDTWPGHHPYDRWHHDDYTRRLKRLCQEASADLIFAVFNNIGKPNSAFGSDLDAVFGKWLQGVIIQWTGPDTPSSGGTAMA